jgi:hypothetical protein
MPLPLVQAMKKWVVTTPSLVHKIKTPLHAQNGANILSISFGLFLFR